MSAAFICDICQKYYKDNDHTTVEGCIKDSRGYSRSLQLNITKRKEVTDSYYTHDEINHICRDCQLKLLDSAYPEFEIKPLADDNKKNN